jgi:formate dehydrogenase subunit delta
VSDSENLVRMANNIAAFFNADPDRDAAVAGVANHIRSFWEARMKKAILAYDAQGGEGLDDLVRKALQVIAKEQA